MSEMDSELRGRFRILNNAMLKKKATELNDPRHIFYKAMLSSPTYEAYLAQVGSKIVQPKTTSYSVSGFMEIRYCRNQRHWIADV